MKEKLKRIFTVSLSLLTLCALLLAAGLGLRLETAGKERFFSGEAQEYYLSLVSAGFPQDYATPLTELHLLHPNWNFVPLLISEINETYTWDYVIEQETKDPQTNLTPASNTYKAYRHPTNTELYDAGYYQASPDTVKYFMDPRNFLNETDIFQFYDLAADPSAELEEINAVLHGTFMADEILENGMSYAAYFRAVGEELGINPVYLAAKVRQEQGGIGNSPVISGKCGDLLAGYYKNQTQTSESGNQILTPSSGYTEEELLALNGYYNLFNVKASGTGLFKIYYNAMNRAVQGSEEKSADWGGSPSWNTKWKSLWGGASLLKKNYIDRYQSTVYLQKFNVDGRAADRNFWGQYMQNVSGAMTESKSIFSAFASVDALDSACTFLIPVYKNMPSQPCADPAGGSCTLLAQAPLRFSYQNEQYMPARLKSENYAIYQSLDVESGDRVQISGSTSHDYGVRGVEYSLDGGEWVRASNQKNYDFSVLAQFPPNSVHILVVRGIADYDNEVSSKKQSYHFLCAVIYLHIQVQERDVSFTVGEETVEQVYPDGEAVTLPDCAAKDFVGWLGSDGSFLPAGSEITVNKDLAFTAQTLSFYHLNGAALSLDQAPPHLRFSAILDRKGYQALSKKKLIRLCAELNTGEQRSDASIASLEEEENWVKLNVNTPSLTDFNQACTASFYAELLYTNGSSHTLYATGETNSRSIYQVAKEALHDEGGTYTKEEQDYLQKLLSNQSQ